MNAALSDIAVLRRRLEDAEAERERISRHIRHLRAVLRGIETGTPVADIEEVDFSRGARSEAPRGDAAPFAAGFPTAFGAPTLAPAASAGAFPTPPGGYPPGFGPVTALGAGLPPGVPAPVPPGPALAFPAIPSVDVGELRTMTPERLDQLPFGVVTLDAAGRVIGYNDTESRLAALPRERVIGRNFFGDVAPCTRVKEFEGRFRAYAEGRTRAGVETFEFVFNFSHGAQRVVILFSPGRHRGEFLMSMIRR